MKALLLENIHASAASHLESLGYEVETRRGALAADDLIAAAAGFDVLGIRSATSVTAEVIEALDGLQVLGAFCIGTNQIDLAAAANAGLAVFNAPFSNTRSVVEIVIGEIIALSRRLTDQNRLMHAGVWDKSAAGAHEIRGRTLGIVGYGNIGAQLSVLAEALGMRVVFFDVADKLALGNARRCGSLRELLEAADIVTLHVDGRPGNAGFFGEAEFDAMRSGALFLNLSRGMVVDHEALHAALAAGRLAGAAIDVFPHEPGTPGEPFTSVLRDTGNVILTPHIGGSTLEAQADIGRFVTGKITDYLATGSTSLSVNLPEVQLPPSGKQRLLHLHRNVPGILAHVNAVLGRHDVNIESQQLATRGALGYAVTDIDSAGHPALLDELRSLPDTVRVGAITW